MSVERESWRCGDHVMRGTCENPKGLHRKDLERPIYEGLKSVFYGPLCIRLFGDRVLKLIEQNEHLADWGAKQAATSLREIDKKIANIIAALEGGQESEGLLKRLSELGAERDSLRRTLSLKNVPIISDDLDMALLFQDALDKLPEIIADRSRNRRALRLLNASFTNRSDWWNHT